MCDRAHQLAVADRKRYPKGGVLLVANDQAHVARLVELMSDKGRGPGIGKVGVFEDMADVSFGCVVVSKGKDRGYNFGTRLGAMIKGTYPGNGASRHQMRGRIRRIGQVRKEVIFCTCVMEHTMLQLLHERQQSVDTLNISLEALAKHFDLAVLGDQSYV
jgi:hypothetical protein